MLAHCPSCNYKKEVPDGSYGKTAKCSKCGTVFTISKGGAARSSNTATIILSIICILLAAGLAVVLLTPEDTTHLERADHLQNRVDHLKAELNEAKNTLAAKSREAAEAVGNLAGVQNMLEARTESLNRAKRTIADLEAEAGAAGNAAEQGADQAGKELRMEVERLRAELALARQETSTAEQDDVQPAAPRPEAIQPGNPAEAPLPEAEPDTAPVPALGSEAKPAPVPGGLMKLHRERPDLFELEVVETSQGFMPVGAVEELNEKRAAAGKPPLAVLGPPTKVSSSMPAVPEGEASSRAPLTPPVQSPAEIKAVIDRGAPDTPAPMPPGVEAGVDPDETPIIATETVVVEEPAPTAPEASAGAVRTVDQTINVRRMRTTDSPVVFKLRPGQAVRLGFYKDDWYAVFKPEADSADESAALGYAYGPLFKK